MVPDPDVSLHQDGLSKQDELGVGRDQGPLRVEDVHQLLEHRLNRKDVLEHDPATQEAVEVEVDAGGADLLPVNLKSGYS